MVKNVCDRTSSDLQVARRRASGALIGDNLVSDFLPFVEVPKPGALDGADVDEHVLAAIIGLDEAEALRCVEPFDGSSSHRCSPVVEWSGPLSPVRYRCGKLPRCASFRTRSRVIGRTSIAA